MIGLPKRATAAGLVVAAALPLAAVVYRLTLVGREDFGARAETRGGQPLFAAITVLVFMAAAAALVRAAAPPAGPVLCVLAAAALVPEGLSGRGWSGAAWSVGRTLATVQVVPVLAIALLHPRYRPRRRDVVALGLLAVSVVAAQAVVVAAPLLPAWPAAQRLSIAVAAAVPCAVVAGLLLGRLVRAAPVVRRALAPTCLVGVAVCVATVVELGGPLVRPEFFVAVTGTPVAHPTRDVVTATLPAALLATAILRRAVVGRFGRDVLAAFRAADVRAVRPALARCLTDPALRVLLPAAGRAGSGLVDLDGTPVAGGPAAGRRHRAVTSSGRPVGVLDVDARLERDDPELLAAVAAAAAPGMECLVVEADLHVQAREVGASRQRLLEAVAEERHDVRALLDTGARRHLAGARAALAGAAPAGGAPADPAAVRDAVRRARAEVQAGLADLRLVAHGVHPAVLGQSGLAAALRGLPESVESRVDVTVTEDVPGARVGTAVEAAAYLAAVDAVERLRGPDDDPDGALPVQVDARVGADHVRVAVSAPALRCAVPLLSRVTGDRVVALGGTVTTTGGTATRGVTVDLPVVP